MPRKTRIIATLGPASMDARTIQKMIQAGMNVARINSSHGDESQYSEIVKNIRKAEKATGASVSIFIDLQGPKIRVSGQQEVLHIKKGDTLKFSTKKGLKNTIHVPHFPKLSQMIKVGDEILIDDGLLQGKVQSKRGDTFQVKFSVSGTLKPGKGINLPGSPLPRAAFLSKRDKSILEFALKTLKVDGVALSFVESAQNVIKTRKIIQNLCNRPVFLISKIERQAALDNLEAIIEASDGVMVARGDLGIEIPAERVPLEQRRIVDLARKKGKASIIATQILASMVENPLPTRAEISDAATACFEHADALMLSNETAVGAHAIRAVKVLHKVSKATEASLFKNTELFPTKNKAENDDESMALEACHLAENMEAKALIISSKRGYGARITLKHRPKSPVHILTNNKSTLKFLGFHWGTENIHLTKKLDPTNKELKQILKLKTGDECIKLRLSEKEKSTHFFRL